MKKIIFSALLLCFVISADAAITGVNRRGTGAATQSNAISAARSATRATGVSRAPVSATSSATSARVAARGAITNPGGIAVRSATATPGIAARSATNQRVLNQNTTITAATANVLVSAECREKYNGCMDSFCMVANTSGGRCACSARNAELMTALAEIEKLDSQSYEMATVGVERIEAGEAGERAIANANRIIDDILNADSNQNNRQSLDLGIWGTVDFDENPFDIFADVQTPIEEMVGDDLYAAADELCVAQIPECATGMQMLRTLYGQNVRGDCTAFENELKRQRTASAQKLATAEQALRGAALDAYRTANRYDLGQCTLAFKECMVDTAGCGADFKGCVGIVAAENAKLGYGSRSKVRMVNVKGAYTQIPIAASTLDALESKRPMCMNVTDSCVDVRDQVWDTFLREAAPAVKSAELVAESDLRMGCIGNISSCIEKACKDTIDPNNPDGSYDMCLSRPETVQSVCKIQLEQCAAVDNDIWPYVRARLAAMRVDTCTVQARTCLTNQNACGKNFENCVGLDLNDIRDMCPIDKLTACNVDLETGEKITSLAQLDDIIMGIYLSIDNAMLEQCIGYVDEKMLEVCGDTMSCATFDDDSVIGTDSLTSRRDTNGNYIIEGLVSFGSVTINTEKFTVETDTYIGNLGATAAARGPIGNRIAASLNSVQNKINQKIALIENDERVKMCINGRDMRNVRSGATGRSGADTDTVRFPHLLKSSKLAIMNAGIDAATKNYDKKLTKLIAEATENANDDLKTAMCSAIAANGQEVTSCTGDMTTSADGTVSGEQVCKTTNPFQELFDGGADTTVAGAYATSYTITGAKINNLLNVASAGKGEWTQIDNCNGMVGKVSRVATYSTADNTCTVTTTTTACEGMEAVITTIGKLKGGYTYEETNYKDKSGNNKIKESSSSVNYNASASSMPCGLTSGSGVSAKKIKNVQMYNGNICKSFSEPIITTEVIAM